IFGLGKFYSSLFQKVIPSVSLIGMSLLDTHTGKSIPLVLRLLKANKLDKKDQVTKKPEVKKGKVGRPKGSKNKPYQEPKSATFQLIKSLIQDLLRIFKQFDMNVQITYAVADSYFGNKHYLKLIESSGFYFISKLRKNTHLVFPYEGIQNALGRRKHLGNKVNFAKLPNKFRLEPKGAQKEEFKDSFIYQFHAYHKNIPSKLLNIIILVNKKDPKKYAILMSSDLELDAFTLIQYYRLRFQIEFSFREAKQYFGISHFQNYKENQVKFATQFAYFMVLLSRILLDSAQKNLEIERLSIRDLKSLYRVSYISNYFLNTSENTPETIFNAPELRAVARWEAVNL
ncbi:MAG: transposase, partial [Bacteroidota bacterium]